jgi:hypothetical protein
LPKSINQNAREVKIFEISLINPAGLLEFDKDSDYNTFF